MTYIVETDHPKDGWTFVAEYKSERGAIARLCRDYSQYGYLRANEPRGTMGRVIATSIDKKARVWV